MKKSLISLFTLLLLFVFNQSKTNAFTNPEKVSTFTLTYVVADANLTGRGYVQVPVPAGYISGINTASYPGLILYLYYKASTNSYIELYKAINAIEAEKVANQEKCKNKAFVNQDGSHGCMNEGNECRVDVSGGPTKPVIICCP